MTLILRRKVQGHKFKDGQGQKFKDGKGQKFNNGQGQGQKFNI